MKTILPAAWRAALLTRLPRHETSKFCKALRPYTDFEPGIPLPPGHACADDALEPTQEALVTLRRCYEEAGCYARPWEDFLADWADHAKQIHASPEKVLGPPKRYLHPEMVHELERMIQRAWRPRGWRR